jgi:uncharacterized protein (DUF952 family)
VVLCVAPGSLIAPLSYENLSGGDELFPHLYGPLNPDAVMKVINFDSVQLNEAGSTFIESIWSQLKD